MKSTIQNTELPADDQIPNPETGKRCDLCGASGAGFVLSTPRLDGPLMRCAGCGLFFVDKPLAGISSVAAAAEMERLASRALDLSLVEPSVEKGEGPWRELTALERLNDLKRFVNGGRLLEIGCSTGELLVAARSIFDVHGVEADAKSCRLARDRGLDCVQGTLGDAAFPDRYFDAAVMYHVIEHFPAPRAEICELARIVKPGGWLILETPNIETFWFRLLGPRWRQIIPDHLYFFSPPTITRLCEEGGFAVREVRSVGKSMSLRLFVSRIGRYHRPSARLLGAAIQRLNLQDRTLNIRLGDVMRVYAQRDK